MRSMDLSHLLDQSRHLKDITYICFILLFSGTIYSIFANPATTDLLTELSTNESVNSTLNVSGMPFAEKLSNPCSAINSSNATSFNSTARNKTGEEIELKRILRHKAEHVKLDAKTILSKDLILDDCSTIALSDVATIPTAEEISNSTPISVLSSFYAFLLNHTAQVYFMGEQSKRYSIDPHCNRLGLQADADVLARNMKELMCRLVLTIQAINDFVGERENLKYPIKKILIEELSDEPVCSKMALKNCQTVRSSKSFAEVFLNYINTSPLFVETNTTQTQTESS